MPDITAPELKSSLGIYRLLAPSAAVRVSPLCLGGMNFGEGWKDFMGECTKETAEKILDYYYENNGNFIDTANHYQNSDSEKWIGDWMHSRQNRDQLVLATKYTTAIRTPHPHEIRANNMGNGAKSLHTSFAASLRNLRTSYVDILYVHWWDFSTGVEEIMQSLNALVVSGKVLYLGISNTPAWIVAKANAYARAHGFRTFSVYQGRWSAEHRDVEREIFPMCQDEGMAFVAWGALGGGNFRTEAQFAEMRGKAKEGRGGEPSDDAVNVSKALEVVAQRKGTTIAAVALAYLLVKAPYVFPIIGCRTLAHLEGNIGALGLELGDEDVKEIEAAKVFDVGYPGTIFGKDLESQWLPGMAGKFDSNGGTPALLSDNIWMKPGYQARILLSCLSTSESAESKMRPSKDESETWYYGIDARMDVVSMLVARSSTYPFQPFTEETRDAPDHSPRKSRKRKAMFTIGNHKIATIYDSELRLRVREILSRIKWKTIDVVRLGYKDEPSCPVILITVDINDVDEDISHDAVNKIHALMVEFHLPDVHAEIKTGRLFEQARYDQDEHYPLELIRVPRLGSGINSAGLSRVGSLCLFLKVDGSNFAMTCQHVVTSSETFTPTETQNIILQPAKQDLEYNESLLDWTLESVRSICKEFDAKKLKYKGEDSASISKDEELKASMVQDELKELVARKSKMDSGMAEVRLPFGTLEHAPGISKHHATNSRRDWALIKLSDDRFQTLPPNVLPPTHFFDDERYMIMKASRKRDLGYHLILDEPTTTGLLPFKELNAILDGSNNSKKQDYESLQVLKHGRTSGWTVGSLNEIRSDCCFECGGQTMEYCVVNIPRLTNFSYQGDSGACLLDVTGRIIGMIHSGNGENVPFGAELTYFTPMEWIIQDIKETLKTDDVVIENHVQEED
ncbi:hypothetical protein V500_09169 [Pseudogymnoascus sp. VKM F-4518 (FW-2643)]|nr:hypothetical protein V500_09169 [Pseudogymnoascus sp. VKM F-4518 (FW-2643)]